MWIFAHIAQPYFKETYIWYIVDSGEKPKAFFFPNWIMPFKFEYN